jgi:hypothetical protein
MASGPMRTFPVEVEEALGPGLEYAHDVDRGIVATGARAGGPWLGVDRAFLVDSDDGRGHRLPVLVALPSSSFAGARLDVELCGGFSGPRELLVGRLPGAQVPVEPILRAAAYLDEAEAWVDAIRATEVAAAARRRYRERKGRGGITGGRAWLPPDDLPASVLTGGPYSAAELSLYRIPPRYRRALDGLLDPEERLHCFVRRPWRLEAGFVDRLRGLDRRSGLLLLTDRQILWLVDHFNPDSYLSDWGVDVRLIPVERLREVAIENGRGGVRLAFEPGGTRGALCVDLPAELEAEARAFVRLACRFLPGENAGRLSRRYEPTGFEFVEEAAARFGQLDEARAMQEMARREAGDVLAFLFSPRREGQRRPLGLWLSAESIGLIGPRPGRATIPALVEIGMTLSPLSARIRVVASGAAMDFPYPGPLAAQGAAFLRLARRLWANTR